MWAAWRGLSATDTNLKRQAAIKVLPVSVAADAERLARAHREAEVLAAPSHPKIAGIYGLEEREGMTALVMELVEGDALSQRLARGAISIDEVQRSRSRSLKPSKRRTSSGSSVLQPTGVMAAGASTARRCHNAGRGDPWAGRPICRPNRRGAGPTGP
jgi:hypothetical protein